MATKNATVYEEFLNQREKAREAILKNKNTGDSIYQPEHYNKAREDRDIIRKMEYGKDAAIFVNAGEAVYDESGNLIRISNIPQLLTDRAVAHRVRVVKPVGKDKKVELRIIRDPLVIQEILKNNVSRPSYSVDIFVKEDDGFKFSKTTTVEAKDVPLFKDSLSVKDFLTLYTSIEQEEVQTTQSEGSISLSDL